MYNISGLYRFPADIDVDRLKGAIKTAFGNHPALQTELEFDNDGNVVQRYCPELLSEVSVIDVPADRKDETLKKFAKASKND